MNTLRRIGKIAAVLSALLMGSAYVASRSFPGLLDSLQVFAGEGGGGAVPVPAAQGDSPATADANSRVLSQSSKSGAVLWNGDVSALRSAGTGKPAQPKAVKSAGAELSELVLPSSKSGLVFTPSQTRSRPPNVAVLSDGTVIQLPGGTTGTAPAPGTSSPMLPRSRVIDGSPRDANAASGWPTLSVDRINPARPSANARPQRRSVPVPANPASYPPQYAPQYQAIPQDAPNQAPNQYQPPAQQKAVPRPRNADVMPGSKSAPVF